MFTIHSFSEYYLSIYSVSSVELDHQYTAFNKSVLALRELTFWLIENNYKMYALKGIERSRKAWERVGKKGRFVIQTEMTRWHSNSVLSDEKYLAISNPRCESQKVDSVQFI